MSETTCQTCRFWAEESPGEYQGQCRRHPPAHLPAVVHLLVRMRDAAHGAVRGDDEYIQHIFNEAADVSSWGWPTTESVSWCGEWQARPTSPPRPAGADPAAGTGAAGPAGG